MIERPQSVGARRDADTSRHRIVIVGGGAGGLPLVTRLGDKLGKRGRAQMLDTLGRFLRRRLEPRVKLH